MVALMRPLLTALGAALLLPFPSCIAIQYNTLWLTEIRWKMVSQVMRRITIVEDAVTGPDGL